jgi:hypothetical protein
MARVDHARAAFTVRCAIYTRKSSDEGLDQEFNSLDAQREACEAYIVSQRHAGWVMLPNMYDDGGLSGGTMERPALKRLLEDIQAGKGCHSSDGTEKNQRCKDEGPLTLDRSIAVGLEFRECLAGGPGFEPRLTESESAVLPLNYPPPDGRRNSVGWTYPR